MLRRSHGRTSPAAGDASRSEEKTALGVRDASRNGNGGTVDRIRNIGLLLRGQLWPIPATISILGLVLAYWLVEYGGGLLSPRQRTLWWVYSGDAGSARELLSSVLSGLITMTSLVVSMTFVILTLAANQLGPRLIMIFIGDRQIQTVLGLFLGTILYVLMVLRTLDDSLGQEAVPHIAITVGSGLTIVCMFTLVFYLHKVARSIIADNVVEKVSANLSRQIRQILPEPGHVADTQQSPPALNGGRAIALEHRGYIQAIDYSALVELASKTDRVLKVDVRAGHFVLRHGAHVLAFPGRPLDEAEVAAVRDAFVIGRERTPAQDLEFGVRQLVEIALRALSPGINDTFTALAVIDHLGAALEDILSRPLQPILLCDEGGAVRVVADRSRLEGLFDASFDLVRQAGGTHPAILIRMADLLGQIAPILGDAAAMRAASAHLAKLEQTARNESLTSRDHEDITRRIEIARHLVDRASRRRSSAFAAVRSFPVHDSPP